MNIDSVSEAACARCAVGIQALERALGRIGDDIEAELRFQRYLSNPSPPPEGEDTFAYLSEVRRASA